MLLSVENHNFSFVYIDIQFIIDLIKIHHNRQQDIVSPITSSTLSLPDTIADSIANTIADSIANTFDDTIADTFADTIVDTFADIFADTIANTFLRLVILGYYIK